MKYICLDLWDKRVGIARNEGNIAFPHGVVARASIIRYLKKYFLEHSDIDALIIGLPFDLYWTDTKQLDKTREFIVKLQSIFPDIEVIWHDERFSSFEASEWFNDHKDDVAASCILQSYLDSKNI